MVTLTIDGVKVEAEEGSNILTAAAKAEMVLSCCSGMCCAANSMPIMMPVSMTRVPMMTGSHILIFCTKQTASKPARVEK